ncbi:MAG: Tic22 family protein [Leptolyngbyaceae bacterium]|nr:Tic22 family protein [Leptolyngbyaceae bacterium]
MKLFVRWSMMLGLVGGALLGSSTLGSMRTLALPEDQILQKLRPVPVFALADAKGAPLVAAAPAGQNTPPVSGVFISQKDAQAFLDSLKTKNPELAKNVRVVPVSLGEVYQLEQASKNKPDRLDFAFVPMKKQVDTAMDLLKKAGQAPSQFNGVPLFIARGGKEQGYLTIQQGKEQIIPVFFKKEELQGLLDRFKQQQPSLTSTVNIQVVNLEGMIQTLQTSDNAQLNQLVLIPPQESLEFVRSLNPASTPAPGKLSPAPTQSKPATPAPKK